MQEKNFILFDDECRDQLLPFTFTRPVCEIRMGILTITGKWEYSLNLKPSYLTQEYLSKKYPLKKQEVNWLINGSVLPDPRLVAQVVSLQLNEAIVENEIVVACCVADFSIENGILNSNTIIQQCRVISPASSIRSVRKLTDIFSMNGEALRDDFKLITRQRRSVTVSESNNISHRDAIFIEEGANVEYAYLNASNGPIYIGKNAEVMEGAMIRGPFSLGEGSVVKMGSKIYYPTTIGPFCKVGGEINNVVMFGNSNKAHDGYLGNAVIGEWCNLGADTNNSNLKNDYSNVKLWNYPQQKFADTGLQFCGVMMGDHSKCGINTMFNTGTVVGVFANLFGDGFPRNFIPSFSWGGHAGITDYKLEKALKVAELVMKRRDQQLTDIDVEILQHIYKLPKR
ncbi:MAG: GlmU family protein [Chitinophagaceae bacterium]|nr:GlmU family protein [Chitinophagaceae bacterium]